MASFLCCRVIRECSMKEELDQKKSDFSQCLCEEKLTYLQISMPWFSLALGCPDYQKITSVKTPQ